MKRAIFSFLAASFLTLPAVASTCFKFDENKSDKVPSYIWIVKKICFDSHMIVSDEHQTQVTMKGHYELRISPVNYPDFIRSEFNGSRTYPSAYRKSLRIWNIDMRDSFSQAHYWKNNTMVMVTGDLSNPKLGIYAEVLEFNRNNGQRYKVVYSMSESDL